MSVVRVRMGMNLHTCAEAGGAHDLAGAGAQVAAAAVLPAAGAHARATRQVARPLQNGDPGSGMAKQLLRFICRT